ncbi:hypothetical protein HWV62_19201 [Athelia sp. TMB]|nr:hypothetical protein HWV62_19201 [Athelia sp. TMB]
MKRDNITSPFSRHLLSPEFVASYDPEGDVECCDATDFLVDIRSSATSKWNKSCSRVFEKSFLDTYPQFQGHINISKSWITHLKHLKGVYQQQEEVDVTRGPRLQRKRREERKLKLYQRRRAVAQTIQKQYHLPILDVVLKLDVNGTSSDESDHESGHGDPTYFISHKHWRSPEVTKALRTLDALHLATRFKECHEATSGSWPHIRTTYAPLHSQRPPVCGLPLNFYNPEWYLALQENSPLDYQDLQPSRMIRIDIPPAIMR